MIDLNHSKVDVFILAISWKIWNSAHLIRGFSSAYDTAYFDFFLFNFIIIFLSRKLFRHQKHSTSSNNDVHKKSEIVSHDVNLKTLRVVCTFCQQPRTIQIWSWVLKMQTIVSFISIRRNGFICVNVWILPK